MSFGKGSILLYGFALLYINVKHITQYGVTVKLSHNFNLYTPKLSWFKILTIRFGYTRRGYYINSYSCRSV